MKRIKMLDVARGLAIIGTLGTNVWLFAGIQQMGTEQIDQVSSLFWIAYALGGIITNGKFLGLLTIMFGIGMQLKYTSYNRRGLPFYKLYAWSMILLFIDGLLHFIFVFEYDVLMSYAVTGLFVAYIIQKSEKTIWFTMISAGVVHLAYQIYTTLIAPGSSLIANSTTGIITNATWMEQVSHRLTNFIELRGEAITIIPMNIFLFLVGVLLVRKGLLKMDKASIKLQNRLMLWGLAIGFPLTFASIIFTGLDRYVAAPVVAIGYLGLVFWLDRHQFFPRIQQAVSRIGKMALSCYVLQNILASVLFYSWGFGLAQAYSLFVVVAVWLGIVLFMMAFSYVWLKFFERGPFELLWTYLSNIPVKHYKNTIN